MKNFSGRIVVAAFVVGGFLASRIDFRACLAVAFVLTLMFFVKDKF